MTTEEAKQRAICKQCKGACCKTEKILVHPQQFLDIKKYLLPGDPAVVKFYFDLNPTGLGCLALGPNGCRIPRKERPAQCISFPWIVHEDMIGFQLSSHCPHVDEFGKKPTFEQLEGLAFSSLEMAKIFSVAVLFLRKKYEGYNP